MSEEQTDSNEAATEANTELSQLQPRGITRITVQGFKSLRDETSIEIRPLTILAGANSSGKSSIMQPLLLMKQTLEAPSDPGALLLNGPNVYFTHGGQMFSFALEPSNSSQMKVTLGIGRTGFVQEEFRQLAGQPLDITEMTYSNARSGRPITLHPGMSHDEIEQVTDSHVTRLDDQESSRPKYDLEIARNKCFLDVRLHGSDGWVDFVYPEESVGDARRTLLNLIHVSGIRGSRERSYNYLPLVFGYNPFPGTFDDYDASVIYYWQTIKDKDSHFEQLLRAFVILGLTDSVEAKPVSDVALELRVGRLSKGSKDTVNIADAGKGVPTVLPVVVALLVAEPGQLVYIEQPELHLHPEAQVAMAGLLADAAHRGVRVVVETHSSLLLLAIQTLIAEDAGKPNADRRINPEDVILHWFQRDAETGVTKVLSQEKLDETGSLGNWPPDPTYDFYNVEANLQRRFVRASSARRREKVAKLRDKGKNGSNGANGSSHHAVSEEAEISTRSR